MASLTPFPPSGVRSIRCGIQVSEGFCRTLLGALPLDGGGRGWGCPSPTRGKGLNLARSMGRAGEDAGGAKPTGLYGNGGSGDAERVTLTSEPLSLREGVGDAFEWEGMGDDALEREACDVPADKG